MAINNSINQYPIVDALLGTWTPGAGTITSADSILTALQKISGSSVALSGNNVWTGTNSFGNTVTFSTLTASTVPYLDASKTLTSSAVTPTELGYVSGVTSAIQTQLNAKASGSGYTASRVMISDGTGALVVSPDITTTELGYLNGATGTTGTGNLVFSASPTFTGTATFDRVDANTLRAVGSGGILLESNSGTDVVLFGAGGGAGVTFYGGLNVAGSFAFTGTGANTLSTNSSDGADDKAIVVAGGGAYGPTRGSGIAVIGNEYAAIGGDLELIAGDSAVSGAIKHYVGDGAGGAYLAVKTERTTGITSFYGGIDCLALTHLRYAVTIGGNATSDSVGLEIGNTAGGTPYIDFKRSAIDYDVRIINGADNTLSFIGASAGYFFDATINSIYSIVATSATATLTTITQGITTAGYLVTSAYVADGYTAGLTWSSTTDNPNKPKAGIFCKTTGAGTYVYIGTSNDYATGITTSSSIGPNGEMEVGSITTAGKIQVGSTTPTASAGSALTINSSVTTGSAGSASIILQGANNTERIKIYSAGGAGTGGPLFNMFSFRGSIASPTATQNGDLLSGVSGGGYGATGYTGNKYVFLQYATENWTDSAQGCYTALNSTANGSTSNTARLLIDHNGTITLGSVFGTGTGALYAGAGTFTGLLTTVASASGGAGFRAPHGAAPSSPTNGDFWTTTAGAYIRINGVTKTFTLT